MKHHQTIDGYFTASSAAEVVKALAGKCEAELVQMVSIPRGDFSEQYRDDLYFIHSPHAGVSLKMRGSQLKGSRIDELRPDVTSTIYCGAALDIVAETEVWLSTVTEEVQKVLSQHHAPPYMVWGYQQTERVFPTEQALLEAYKHRTP